MDESYSQFVPVLSVSGLSAQWTHCELLSEHGARRVYRATRYGRRFVLKTLRGADKDMLVQQRLQKEFALGIELEHPNIVRIISYELVPEVGECIIMEFVDGMTLSDFLLTRPSKVVKRRLFFQLLDAVQYLHSRQMVHRDIKPSNILVTRNGNNIKLIDFGLTDTDDSIVCCQTVGTVGFASPEQIKGGPLDCRSDIYGLGKVLRLLCPQYKCIAAKCTREEPSRRYSSCEALRKALVRRDNWLRWIPFTVGLLCLLMALALSLTVYLRPNPRNQVIQQAQDLISQQYQLICSQPPSSLQEYSTTLSYFYERCAVMRDSVAATIEDDALRADFVNAAVVTVGQFGTVYRESLTGLEWE